MQQLDMPRPEFGVFNESKNCDIDVPKLHFLQDYYFLSDNIISDFYLNFS